MPTVRPNQVLKRLLQGIFGLLQMVVSLPSSPEAG